MRSLAKASDREMQIDHFDPRQKKNRIQVYANLFLADAHCNGTKSDTWPDKEESDNGLRFLNCCEEQDYGHCIFEDPETHELVGTTPAAIYHIEMIDLNAPHLVDNRRRRAEIRDLLNRPSYLFVKDGPIVCQISKTLEKIAEVELIPPIPPPPPED